MVLFLLKFVEKREYAESFLRGELYMNTLASFAEMEDDEEGRADNHEGVTALFQTENIVLEFTHPETGEVFTIPGSDMAAPVRFTQGDLRDTNVFCLFAGHTGGTNIQAGKGTNEILSPKETRERDLQHLLPSGDAAKMGEYVVFITNVGEFFKRVQKATKEVEHWGGGMGLVTYYDESSIHGAVSDESHVLCKRRIYEHQREYRIHLKTRTRGPFVLQVGDLSDIAEIFRTEDLDRIFAIEEAPEEEAG